MRRPPRLTIRPPRNASGNEATGNDLHDAYVQAVNAALTAGRENVAHELAADYARDRRHGGHDHRSANPGPKAA